MALAALISWAAKLILLAVNFQCLLNLLINVDSGSDKSNAASNLVDKKDGRRIVPNLKSLLSVPVCYALLSTEYSPFVILSKLPTTFLVLLFLPHTSFSLLAFQCIFQRVLTDVDRMFDTGKIGNCHWRECLRRAFVLLGILCLESVFAGSVLEAGHHKTGRGDKAKEEEEEEEEGGGRTGRRSDNETVKRAQGEETNRSESKAGNLGDDSKEAVMMLHQEELIGTNAGYSEASMRSAISEPSTSPIAGPASSKQGEATENQRKTKHYSVPGKRSKRAGYQGALEELNTNSDKRNRRSQNVKVRCSARVMKKMASSDENAAYAM